MRRLAALATLTICLGLAAPALAQSPTVLGPGGIPLAPGSPVPGYTPGGIGPGGVEVAPGRAARNVLMYRIGPGGVPYSLGRDRYQGADEETTRLQPGDTETAPQSLILTITSRDAGPGQAPSPDTPIDSIPDLFAALRACWEPPAPEQAREGLQMSVRFSFKRSGELIGPPFTTYTTPGTQAEMKQVYRRAIEAALKRCAPMPLSQSFSAAITGRPISVRYVDDRSMSASVRPQ
jgi:hypothetical protein